MIKMPYQHEIIITLQEIYMKKHEITLQLHYELHVQYITLGITLHYITLHSHYITSHYIPLSWWMVDHITLHYSACSIRLQVTFHYITLHVLYITCTCQHFVDVTVYT